MQSFATSGASSTGEDLSSLVAFSYLYGAQSVQLALETNMVSAPRSLQSTERQDH